MIAHQIRPRPSSLEKAQRSPKYLRFLRTRPCVVPDCRRTNIEAAHTGNKGAAKGVRACDFDAVPLCQYHHTMGPRLESIHSTSEWVWQAHHGIHLEDERARLRAAYREGKC